MIDKEIDKATATCMCIFGYLVDWLFGWLVTWTFDCHCVLCIVFCVIVIVYILFRSAAKSGTHSECPDLMMMALLHLEKRIYLSDIMSLISEGSIRVSAAIASALRRRNRVKNTHSKVMPIRKLPDVPRLAIIDVLRKGHSP